MPANWIGHCHCNQCKQLHGAAFVTWAGFKTDDFEVIDPDNLFKTYNSWRADRGFCTNCWSSFYFKYNDNDTSYDRNKYVYFTRANIETKINVKPVEHIHFDSHADWFDILDDLPKRKSDYYK